MRRWWRCGGCSCRRRHGQRHPGHRSRGLGRGFVVADDVVDVVDVVDDDDDDDDDDDADDDDDDDDDDADADDDVVVVVVVDDDFFFVIFPYSFSVRVSPLD